MNEKFSERMKRNFNLKKLTKLFTIVMGAGLIVFMSIANVSFDNEKFSWRDFAFSSLIMIGIMVFGLLMGESVGSDQQKEKIGGRYQTELCAYDEIHRQIEPMEIYFGQWFQWYSEKRGIAKRIDYLVSNGFEREWANAIVMHLESTELETLTKQSIEKDGVIVKRVNEDQREILKALWDGSLNLDTPTSDYYLTAESKSNVKDMLEQPHMFERDLRANKFINRTLKIVSSIFISLIWSLMTVREFQGGEATQAWFNLFSRLTSLITAFSAGWATSVLDIRIRADMVLNKTNVLKMFQSCLDKREFTPKTYDEIAKEQFEREKKEREEAIASIVTPEAVGEIEISKIEMKE